MKSYLILPSLGGLPSIGDLTYSGSVCCGEADGFGAFLVSGTEDEIAAIEALDTVQVLCRKVELTDAENATVDEAPADDGGDVAPIEPSPPVFVGGGKLAIGGDIKPSIVKPASQLQAMAVERVDTLNDFLAVQGMEAIAEDMSGAEAVDVVFRGFSPLFRQEICDVADVTI